MGQLLWLWGPVALVERPKEALESQVSQVIFTVIGQWAAAVGARQEQRLAQQCAAKTEALVAVARSIQVRRVSEVQVSLAETAARPYLLPGLVVARIQLFWAAELPRMLVTVGPEAKGHQTLIQVFR